MKTLWAVACAASLGLLVVASTGCSSAPKKPDSATNVPTPSKPAAEITEIAVSELPRNGSAPSATQPTGTPSSSMSATPIPVVQAATGPMYRIGPEDILRVSVWENKELTLDVMVRPDGKISLPLIQDVQAEGLTAVELSSVIHTKLLAYLTEPQVSVIVIQVNAPKFFIVGNVGKPGSYPLRGDMSVLQALSLAGGFTQFASPRRIKLVRGRGDKQEVRMINYYKLIGDGGEDNYLLKPGDTIVVP